MQYATPNPPKDKIDADFQAFTPTADILFVIDDSISMGSHQANLIANLSEFTDEFTKGATLDYHIGVVSTDMDSYYKSGKLQGTTAFVTPKTPNGMRVLERNLDVGTSGSGYEKPFDSAAAVFDPSNATVNKGFIRPEAALAVIFITDAEDQSVTYGDPNALYDYFVLQKGGDTNKVLGYGALVVPNEIWNCPSDDYIRPTRIFNFLDLVMNKGSNTLRLCQKDFGKQLASWSRNIVANAGRTIFLKQIPSVDSIVVKYGSLVLPSDPEKGWSYDPARNAILLGDKIDWASQPIGSQIKVKYDAVNP